MLGNPGMGMPLSGLNGLLNQMYAPQRPAPEAADAAMAPPDGLLRSLAQSRGGRDGGLAELMQDPGLDRVIGPV